VRISVVAAKDAEPEEGQSFALPSELSDYEDVFDCDP
jgi:hypothetical protein